MSVQAEIWCREQGGRIGVGVLVPDPIEHFMAHHSYTTEVVLRSSAGTRTWWYGGGGDLTEEPIGDDPVFCGEAWVPEWEGAAELTLTLRLHAFWDDEGDEREQTWWWSGGTALQLSTENQKLVLDVCQPRAGAPFEVGDVPRLETEHGPTLIPIEEDQIADIVNRAGAVLPDVGVYCPNLLIPDGRRGVLLTERGRVPVPSFQPEGDCYHEASIGGPRGALATVWNHRLPDFGGAMQIALARLPDGAPRFTKRFEGYCMVHAAVWDARGEKLGAAIFAKNGMRVYVIDAEGRILSDVPGEPLGEWADELAWGVGLEWRGEELVATWAGADGPTAVAPGWRQYGAGLPTCRRIGDRVRTAWVVCAEFPRIPREGGGTTIIAWLDDDEAHGQVVVPDHGWAQDGYRFGKLAILEDGRIVAIGTKIWRVDPASGEVVSLGEAGDYPRHLPIHEDRLYNRGPGPWWTRFRSGT